MLEVPANRVTENSSAAANGTIRREMEIRLSYYAQHRDRIEERLRELDGEWDVERVLETNAAAIAFGGTALGLLVHRKFLLIPLVVTVFLLQHAVEGWCPPLPLLRRMGIRTQQEIEAERYALKGMRGDLRGAVGVS